MHGYELITVLEQRRAEWKPSPGAIYPALGKLEERGLVTSSEQDGKRLYELTEEGHTVAAEVIKRSEDSPWEQLDVGHGDLRRVLAELVRPARQIGRFGTVTQPRPPPRCSRTPPPSSTRSWRTAPASRNKRTPVVSRAAPCLTGSRSTLSPWRPRSARASVLP